MKKLRGLVTLLLIIVGCQSKEKAAVSQVVIDSPSIIKPTLKEQPDTAAALIKQSKIFPAILNYPTIKDSAKFIEALVNGWLPYVDYERIKNYKTEITFYKKIKLFGAKQELIFLEYDYKDGSMASYPWKYQLLFDVSGSCIKSFSAQRFEFLKIFPNSAPLLLTVIVTAKGNGGHQLYKMSGDSLENVYDGYLDYEIQTYDAHEDNTVFEPRELKITIQDDNHDGLNDIVFSGKIVLIQGVTSHGVWYDYEIKKGDTVKYSTNNPFLKVPIQLVFLYNKHTGHFVAKEDYDEKYKRYHY